MLDLHLLRLQFSREPQPNVRHLLAHSSEHGLAVLLKFLTERIDIRLVQLVARAFRPTSGISDLTGLEAMQIRE